MYDTSGGPSPYAFHSFTGSGPTQPSGPLVQKSGNTFFGVSNAGGIGYGTFYKTTGPNNTATTCFIFNGITGDNAVGNLRESEGSFYYGVTSDRRQLWQGRCVQDQAKLPVDVDILVRRSGRRHPALRAALLRSARCSTGRRAGAALTDSARSFRRARQRERARRLRSNSQNGTNGTNPSGQYLLQQHEHRWERPRTAAVRAPKTRTDAGRSISTTCPRRPQAIVRCTCFSEVRPMVSIRQASRTTRPTRDFTAPRRREAVASTALSGASCAPVASSGLQLKRRHCSGHQNDGAIESRRRFHFAEPVM